MKPALAILFLFAAACGDDSDPAPDDASGDARDGRGADGEVGPDGSRDGGPDVRADGDADAEPTCETATPLPMVTLEASSTCEGDDPCGGELAGSAWALDAICVEDDVRERVRSVCSAATISISGSATGSLAFVDGQLVMAIDASADGTVSLPNACTGCRCGDAEVALSSTGLDVSCSPECAGGICTCFVRSEASRIVSGAYVATGSHVMTDDGAGFDYCRTGDELAITGAEGYGSLRFRALPVGAEQCNGRDDDLDGEIDEDPEDCRTCGSLGVCAGTVVSTCEEGVWSCDYRSSDYEPYEQTCDRLDNDCNGEVDEPASCGPEVCDGIDNDGNGDVDDAPTDSPCMTEGVCSDRVETCMGAAGWTCTYNSMARESSESTCDRLDNDCDGEVDEPETCRERCDGVDNDADGMIDDSPIDTPICPRSGVCASGGTPSCGGAMGWTCNYTSADHEVGRESRCDGLDNDCDGKVDEPCGACASVPALIVAETRFTGFETLIDLCRVELATHTVTSLFTLPSGSSTIEFDEPHGKIYFVNAGAIERMNLDGTGRETVHTPAAPPYFLTVDEAGSTVYFSDSLTASSRAVRRVAIGSSTSEVISTASGMRDLAIAGGQLYLLRDCEMSRSLYGGYCLYRSALDGTGPIEIAASPWNLLAPVVDLASNQVYLQEDFKRLRAVSLDGLRNRVLTELMDFPAYVTVVAVDSGADWVYYDADGDARRMHADGSGDESFRWACGISSARVVGATTTGCTAP